MNKVKRGLDELVDILRNSKSDRERKKAIEELRDMGKEAKIVLKDLMRIVNGRDNFVIQGIAEEAVVKIGQPAIQQIAKLLKSPLQKKRSKGLGLLCDIALEDKKTVNEILIKIEPVALWDFRFNVRSDAVKAIGKILEKNKKNQEAIQLLGKILRKDRHPNVSQEASQMLEKGEKKLVLQEIMKSIERKNYPFYRMSGDNRVNAANVLYLIANEDPSIIKEAVPTLLKLLEKDPYPPLRVTVLLPIVMIGGWDVIEDVLLIAVEDRWYQVRSAALSSTQLLVNQKATKKKIESLISILKKIEREEKYSYIQDNARDLIEEFTELLH